MERGQFAAVVVAVLAMGPLLGTGVGLAVASASEAGVLQLPLSHAPSLAPSSTRFTFVSNFENGTLGNWSAITGTASIVHSPNYLGEPALSSAGTLTSPQIDHATKGFVRSSPQVSFQAELYYGGSTGNSEGFVGLLGPHGFVAAVGVNGTTVWAGSSIAAATKVGAIPTGSAQPSGWVDLMAIITNTTTSSGSVWLMNVYVDETDVIAAANVSVPNAGHYVGAAITTERGTVEYTNIVFSSYEIPTTIPGYNNMEGYGQGSGLLVTELPKFTTLTAQMTLTNWSIPQKGILSFQINAMNLIGTTKNTCYGFYQLGIDLDPNGHIAPWYVPNNNCVADYFATNSPRLNSGFATPAGTRLTLKITDAVAKSQILFQIIDQSITGANHTSQVAISYNGSEFFGVYTQMEWQPCCSVLSIDHYHLNATLSDVEIDGGSVSAPMLIPATYMVPYALDAPLSWNFGYFEQATATYAQVA